MKLAYSGWEASRMCCVSRGRYQEASRAPEPNPQGVHMALLATHSDLFPINKVKGRILYWKYFCLINTLSIQQSSSQRLEWSALKDNCYLFRY